MRELIPALPEWRRAFRHYAAWPLLVLVLVTTSANAQVAGSRIAAAAPGMVETGAPSFVVLGPEAIGLSAPPTDMHLLRDGRVLVISPREIALSDGVRWEVFGPADGQPALAGQVAVDDDGQIYTGIRNGIGRVEFGADARWRVVQVATLPAEPTLEGKTPFYVAMLGSNWLWHSGSGLLTSWKPGQSPNIVGSVQSIDRIFALQHEIYVSEQASGGLYRLNPAARTSSRISSADRLASETVTSSATFRPGELLLGTHAAGLKLFDGLAFHEFNGPALLAGGHRITDLINIDNRFFAAAVDTVGIVFFDHQGKLVQVLDRTPDHRLARVRRLQYSDSGVLWALLNGAVARVEFPSPISHFEPVLASGLTYVRPLRHAGSLWVLADGRAQRAVYDRSHRLDHFEDATPPGRYLFTLSDVAGELIATNETGIFAWRDGAWLSVANGIVNARVLALDRRDGEMLYVARNEYGILARHDDAYTVRHIAAPGLYDCYNAGWDKSGKVWLELGASLIGRIDPTPAEPKLEIFGTDRGLVDGWIELSIVNDVARFHADRSSQHFVFDEATQRFIADPELDGALAMLHGAGGRPTVDALGQIWFTKDGEAKVFNPKAPAAASTQTIHLGFSPVEYTIQDDGVVWAYANGQFARIDPRIPPPTSTVPRAIITSVEFQANGRHVFNPGAALPTLNYAENSFLIHFAAPTNPFTAPTTFETLLEGSGGGWLSTGNVGSATYNRLKEGRYVFHVRPITAEGRGVEATLGFTIKPPWYRTSLAWILYVVGGLGCVAMAAWFSAILQRRENEHLEHLVRHRTEELNTTNVQLSQQINETTEKSAALALSEERYRTLNTQLEKRVDERTALLSLSNEELRQRESLFRLIFEHAPVGISWKRADLGEVHHVNTTFRRILNLPGDTFKDYATLAQLVHPDDVPQQHAVNERILSGRIDSYNLEERFLLGDGRPVWGSLSVAVIRDDTGRIVQDIGILEDITARKQAESQLAKTYKELVDASRMAGMAEVATGVLHNVGNVLNSLNVSSNLILTATRQSKAASLLKLAALLNERAGDLANFLTQDTRGRLVPEVLTGLAEQTAKDRDWLLEEMASMQKNIDHIKEIVAMQQSYATVLGVVETLQVDALVEDALRMNSAVFHRDDVQVVREYEPVPPLCTEKPKLLQILVNILRNAKHACDDAQQLERRDKIIVIRIEPAGAERVRISVRDNGVGIPAENLTRIFAHGFTTRAYGHGFGLHASALAAKEMGGSLTAQSDGPGKGALFALELPIAPPHPIQGANVRVHADNDPSQAKSRTDVN